MRPMLNHRTLQSPTKSSDKYWTKLKPPVY